MQKSSKTLDFMRKNLVYFIIAFCILAIGLSVTLMLVTGKEDSLLNEPDDSVINPVEPDEPDDPVDNPDDPIEPIEPVDPVDKTIIFLSPVENPSSIGEYSATMVWNSTLSRFSAHLATDFFAAEGTKVLAVYDGEIEKVEKSLLTGVTITVDHGNGLKTVYNSLAEDVSVTEGQSVKQGDEIGRISTTNLQEYKDGAHLHFEVSENGESVDPSKYLTLDLK